MNLQDYAQRGSQHGVTLVEILVTLLVVSLTVLCAYPTVDQLTRTARLSCVTHKLSSVMQQCRARAVFQHQSIALVFEYGEHDGWRCFIAEDGDGDGVLRDDITRRRDPVVSEVYELGSGDVGLGILPEGRIPNPSRRGILRGDRQDPVRAGRGDIITFTPEGTSTPCSVYLTDNRSQMRVVRVYGGTGKVHLLEWRRGWKYWRRPAW